MTSRLDIRDDTHFLHTCQAGFTGASPLQRINQVNFSSGSVPTENLDSGSLQAGAQRRSKRKVPKIICSTRIKASERRKQAWIGTNF
jgi:hypothetical protein